MEIKQLLAIITCLGVLGWTATSNAAGRPETAGPPEHAGACSANADERPEKPGKVLIAHCGCNEEGTDLVWKHIKVSTKALGHLKHKRFDDSDPRPVGCIALNSAGGEVELLHKQETDDCRLVEEGNNNIIGTGVGLPDCAINPAPELGGSCSIEGPQVVPEPEPEP
jgi:hypothetical protein